MGVSDKWKNSFWPQEEMSKSFVNSIFLAMSGGFQDAYTYFSRGKVFANAQTGNVVLMSQHFFEKEWLAGLRYLLPILAFAMGVFVVEQLEGNFRYAKRIHWRQGVVLIEIAGLFVVGFIPTECDVAANALVSFVCAMQVQAFRKVSTYAYASTMCIGNLRSGTASLSAFLRERRPEYLKQALHYFGVIFVFAIGAGAGGVLSLRYGIRSIWVCCGLLLVSVILMALEKYRIK